MQRSRDGEDQIHEAFHQRPVRRCCCRFLISQLQNVDLNRRTVYPNHSKFSDFSFDYIFQSLPQILKFNKSAEKFVNVPMDDDSFFLFLSLVTGSIFLITPNLVLITLPLKTLIMANIDEN